MTFEARAPRPGLRYNEGLPPPVLRPFVALVVDAVLALGALLRTPLRLLGRPRAPRFVQLRLTGDPPWRELPRRGLRWRRRRPRPDDVISLHALDLVLERVAGDARVAGIVLEVDQLTAPAAKRAHVAERLLAFRARGKQVVGTAIAPGNAEYGVLCAADRIALHPAGRLELRGFVVEATAVGAALERLGVQPEFVRRGDHKTAPELFTRTDVSPIQRETLERFLDERHAELVEAVAAGRGLSRDEARARVDAGPYTATRAKEAGLVDVLADDLALPAVLGLDADADAALEGRAGIAPVGMLDRSRPWPRVRWRSGRPPARLALVTVSGMIVDRSGGGLPLGRAVASADTLVQGLRAAARDRRTKAVLLHVDSPGGSALASERILAEVERLAARKPVVAYVDRVAASGGYMVALGAKELWAGPGSILGSIGVFAGKFDLSGLLAKLGIARAVLTRGDNAGQLTAARPLTTAERQALETDVDEVYARFVELVARHRRMPEDAVRARGDGRVYTAARAKEAGLVDVLGAFEGACRRALELASVTARDFVLQPFGMPRSPGPLAALLRGASGTSVDALLPSVLDSVEGLLDAAGTPAVHALWWPAAGLDEASEGRAR